MQILNILLTLEFNEKNKIKSYFSRMNNSPIKYVTKTAFAIVSQIKSIKKKSENSLNQLLLLTRCYTSVNFTKEYICYMHIYIPR
jgi:hypothetical protein